jgi:general transcription factor 3C polypeptide 1
MFIDKMPHHTGWSEGWFFLCDLLLRFPLSMFVKIVNVNREVNGLEEYLKHPIKQHLLLQHLPMQLRQGLAYNRKYLFSVFEDLTLMVSHHLSIAIVAF